MIRCGKYVATTLHRQKAGEELHRAREGEGGDGGAAFAIKVFLIEEGMEDYREQLMEGARERIEVQRRAAAADPQRWAPILATAELDQGTAFATRYYPASLEDFTAAGSTPLSAAQVYAVMEDVLRALSTFHGKFGRGHGKLHAANVLVTDRALDRAEVHLSDPASDPGEAGRSESRRQDLREVGKILYRLVEKKEAPANVNAAFQRETPGFAGLEESAAWVKLCKRLLGDMSEAQGLTEARAALEALGALRVSGVRRGSTESAARGGEASTAKAAPTGPTAAEVEAERERKRAREEAQKKERERAQEQQAKRDAEAQERERRRLQEEAEEKRREQEIEQQAKRGAEAQARERQRAREEEQQKERERERERRTQREAEAEVEQERTRERERERERERDREKSREREEQAKREAEEERDHELRREQEEAERKTRDRERERQRAKREAEAAGQGRGTRAAVKAEESPRSARDLGGEKPKRRGALIAVLAAVGLAVGVGVYFAIRKKEGGTFDRAAAIASLREEMGFAVAGDGAFVACANQRGEAFFKKQVDELGSRTPALDQAAFGSSRTSLLKTKEAALQAASAWSAYERKIAGVLGKIANPAGVTTRLAESVEFQEPLNEPTAKAESIRECVGDVEAKGKRAKAVVEGVRALARATKVEEVEKYLTPTGGESGAEPAVVLLAVRRRGEMTPKPGATDAEKWGGALSKLPEGFKTAGDQLLKAWGSNGGAVAGGTPANGTPAVTPPVEPTPVVTRTLAEEIGAIECDAEILGSGLVVDPAAILKDATKDWRRLIVEKHQSATDRSGAINEYRAGCARLAWGAYAAAILNSGREVPPSVAKEWERLGALGTGSEVGKVALAAESGKTATVSGVDAWLSWRGALGTARWSDAQAVGKLMEDPRIGMWRASAWRTAWAAVRGAGASVASEHVLAAVEFLDLTRGEPWTAAASGLGADRGKALDDLAGGIRSGWTSVSASILDPNRSAMIDGLFGDAKYAGLRAQIELKKLAVGMRESLPSGDAMTPEQASAALLKIDGFEASRVPSGQRNLVAGVRGVLTPKPNPVASNDPGFGAAGLASVAANGFTFDRANSTAEIVAFSGGAKAVKFRRVGSSSPATYLMTSEVPLWMLARPSVQVYLTDKAQMVKEVVKGGEPQGICGWKIENNQVVPAERWYYSKRAPEYPASLTDTRAPTGDTPVHRLPVEVLVGVAKALGCELPTKEVWDEAQRQAGTTPVNTRDERWNKQRAYVMNDVPEGSRMLYAPWQKALSSAVNAEFENRDDGFVWFREAMTDSDTFVDLLGNVAELLSDRTCVGGSALSGMFDAPVNVARKMNTDYADLGLRLMFTTNASAPVATGTPSVKVNDVRDALDKIVNAAME